MFEKLELRKVMTPVPYTVKPGDSIAEVRKQLSNHNVRHLPVRDGDTLVGIISDRDVSLSTSLAAHVVDESALTAGDICTSDPYTVKVDDRFDQMLKYMAHNRIGSALVLEEGELVGIITTTDVCRVCGEFLEELIEKQK